MSHSRGLTVIPHDVTVNGDVDIGGHSLRTTNMVVYEGLSYEMRLTNHAKTTYQGLRMGDLVVGSVTARTGASQLNTRSLTATDYFLLRARKTNAPAAWVDQIRLINDATTPKVTMPNLPAADPADGTSTLWSNGGVVTVGT